MLARVFHQIVVISFVFFSLTKIIPKYATRGYTIVFSDILIVSIMLGNDCVGLE